MFFKNSLVCQMSSFFTNFLIVCYILTLSFNVIEAEKCLYVNDCKCQFQNGSVIDLSSLGSKNQPRWEDIKTTNPNDTYLYSFNLCPKFSIGNGVCQNVYVCQRNQYGNESYNCGDKMYPSWNDTSKTLVFLYSSFTDILRQTNVTLVCSPEVRVPTLTVIGETSPRSAKYEIVLATRCACADLCREDHLSTGSVLVIIFFIFVFFYLFFGIIHSRLTRGAHGWELLPHYEFWFDLPLLVRDGCVFVMSGCKADQAYEKI